MAGLLSPMRYATVVYLTAPAARSVVQRAAASLSPGEQNRVAVRDLPAAAFTPEAGAAAMSVWAWLKLTACLWLLRKMVKVTGWLLLAAAAVAAWPVTLVAVAGYVAAWLRGWPPVRLSRAAAACLLPVTAVWLVAEASRHPAWQAIALAPVRDWERGWHHVTDHRRGPDVPAGGARRDPGRARAGRAGVGVADLRDDRRDRRLARLRADHVRRPPVETPGPDGQGPDRRARQRPAAGPGRADPGRRHHPHHRAPLAPGVRRPATWRAPGTW